MIKVSDKEAAELMEDHVGVWDENTTMPFGMYSGLPLSEVPAKYLLWWYGEESKTYPGLKAYIDENYEELEDAVLQERAYECE